MVSSVYFLFLSSPSLGNFGKSLVDDIVRDHGHWQHTIELSFIKQNEAEKDFITLFYSTSQLYTYMYTAPPGHAKRYPQRQNHKARRTISLQLKKLEAM